MTIDHTHPKRGLYLSIRIKMMIVITLFFAAGFAIAVYWFYTFATDRALGRIEEDLRDTLNGAIAGIENGDFEVLAEFANRAEAEDGSGVSAGNEIYSNPLYLEHQHWIEQIVRVEPRAIPYTFVPTGEGSEVQWVGDSFRVIPERQDSQTAFGESYDADPSETRLYEGLTETTVNMESYTDQWGTWVSAYGPITNAQGEIIGGMGIDFNAEYVADVQRQIRETITYAAIGYAAVSLLFVYGFSTLLTRPISALTGIAEEIGEGDYEQDLTPLSDARIKDEISTLASVFDVMVEKVAEREQSLKQKVASLQIIIDERKRDEQVGELTDSDFFQDLKQKADDLRQRRSDT
jgi:HAMP domain-containing protein